MAWAYHFMYVYRKAKYKELSTNVYRNHRSKMKDRDDRVAASVCQRDRARNYMDLQREADLQRPGM